MKTMKNRLGTIFLPALVLAAMFAAHPARAQQAATADSLGAYELSEVEVLPQMQNRRDVVRYTVEYYPRDLRRTRQQGTVTLRFIIRADGPTDSDHISVENSSNAAFEHAGVRVVRQMRFSPARINGERVPVWVTLPIVFFPPPRYDN
ncbi:MAG TPA: energy transducer TonB [Longimicrobium sp.]|nr:energy transducer TonB [Longimicrobium sp.]